MLHQYAIAAQVTSLPDSDSRQFQSFLQLCRPRPVGLQQHTLLADAAAAIFAAMPALNSLECCAAFLIQVVQVSIQHISAVQYTPGGTGWRRRRITSLLSAA